MEPTSFIPRKPEIRASQHFSGSLLYSLSLIVFILAILASVGVFAYQKISEKSLARMQSDLEAARGLLQPGLIRELSRANARFEVAGKLLKDHILLSSFFNLLESLTLQPVRFTSFSFIKEDDRATVSLRGEARSYASLAVQSKIFGENPNILNHQFSGLDLNKDGNVTFTWKATLNPKLISYFTFLESFNNTLPPVVVPVSQVSTTTPSGQATSTSP